MKAALRKILRWFKNYTKLLATIGVIAALIANINTIVDFLGKHFTNPKLQLSLSIQSWDLYKESGKSLGETRLEESNVEELLKKSAEWVKSTLDKKFPRNDKHIQVTASVDKGQLVVIPPDPLRQDRYWLFGFEGKEGHFYLRDAKEAIESTSKPLLLHFDRPGYGLELIELAIKGEPQTVTMERLPEPSLTVIVDSLAVNETIAERLREKLRGFNLTVGSPELLKEKKQAYQDSRKAGISNPARLAHLRAARIDAFIRVSSYTETAKVK
jgi:hypothetical protein